MIFFTCIYHLPTCYQCKVCVSVYLYLYIMQLFNPTALRRAKTYTFGPSECKGLNDYNILSTNLPVLSISGHAWKQDVQPDQTQIRLRILARFFL